MALALPDARGLFSTLQNSLAKARRNRVRITTRVRHAASDFRAIADSLGERPTRLQELIPSTPTYIEACDACQIGMGGVWFGHDQAFLLLWRCPFSAAIQSD